MFVTTETFNPIVSSVLVIINTHWVLVKVSSGKPHGYCLEFVFVEEIRLYLCCVDIKKKVNYPATRNLKGAPQQT